MTTLDEAEKLGHPTFDEINKLVKERHRVSIDTNEGSGERWWCSCGTKSSFSPLSRTQAQTQAMSDRHLRAAFHRIKKELGA
ncbi:hypothetical protein SEA_FUZZBUSTER_80 [Microbacterium phage FuzzBuster]|uniref:Uncharacterized protein n=1 Tax=Microbacterium phage FuzzBuster TaxID=2590935 RepID=A0A516KV61_9CAUD|nr:hypothetical protein SEA_FUZZBUSTER_80 [Microbacterium phage FuzzBuster]